MMSERDAVKHASSTLLASAVADERLASAMLTIEELTAKLSDEQRDHQRQVNTT